MVKMWIGPEMEGKSIGIDTLFIQTNKLLNINTVTEIINKYNIKRVYLGGGRLDFVGFEDSKDQQFIDFCKLNSIELLIETSLTNLLTLTTYLEYATIIITVRDNNFKIADFKNVFFKLDDYDNCILYDLLTAKSYITNLDSVKDNKYDCDKIILEEA